MKVVNLFKWQNTCSAFSVSKSDVVRVYRYIENQPNHNKTVNLESEQEQFRIKPYFW
jgi:intein-encoded DNA endonuclease-like protein